MAQTWEYLLIDDSTGGSEYVREPALNHLGQQGWEVVAVSFNEYGIVHALFKRPMEVADGA